jgi:hypothetical protein
MRVSSSIAILATALLSVLGAAHVKGEAVAKKGRVLLQ